MSATIKPTALFPLGQPLFPGVIMRLRIFEQRYLNLVRSSMRLGEPFAIVPITRGREVGVAPEIYPFGTLVNIVDFDQQQDGLLGISILGHQRIRVLDSNTEDDGLLVASTEVLPEPPGEEVSADCDDLVKLLSELEKGLQVEDLFPDEPLTTASLGWRLATLLPLPGQLKMALLGEDDPQQRLRQLRAGLAEITGADKPASS